MMAKPGLIAVELSIFGQASILRSPYHKVIALKHLWKGEHCDLLFP